MVFIKYDSNRPLSGLLSYFYYKNLTNFYEIDAGTGTDGKEPSILFKRDKDECDFWYGTSSRPNLTIKLKHRLLLTNYEIENAGCSTKARTFPKAFNLFGSNNGKDWTLIDNQTNQNFCGEIVCATRNISEYSIKNHVPFRFFRMQSTNNSGGQSYLILRSIEMYGFLMSNSLLSMMKANINYCYLILILMIYR